ncbi:metallophosphoesterase [Azohydromonas aeria]|uniref:metallophosphoesterase n=1 Tax=Azohydromonas aeria TaxID=2590212 RepID=UPI0012F7BF45|nr:metallophosphoesterase [Azohydromonas aeria]
MPLISTLPDTPLDIVGDVHGEHAALLALMRRLGYDGAGRHPQGRRLVFVGDLCDRGPDSPAVIDQVRRIVEGGHGHAVLGNHELHLLRGERREGNDWFWNEGAWHDHKYRPCAALPAHRRREVTDFLSTLPLALERADLRVVHAAWYAPGIEALRAAPASSTLAQQFDHWEGVSDAAVSDPELRRLVCEELAEWGRHMRNPDFDMPMLWALGLSDALWQMSNPLRPLTSGIEREAGQPFFSNGKWRFAERVRWWLEYAEAVPVVVGHYWRHFQGTGAEVAGLPSSDCFDDPDALAWHGPRRNVFCVDFSVGARFLERNTGARPGAATRLAALRWPERSLVFDTGEAFSPPAGEGADAREWVVDVPC